MGKSRFFASVSALSCLVWVDPATAQVVTQGLTAGQPAVPDQDAGVAADATPSPAPTGDAQQEIVVQGLRHSLATAQQLKMKSDAIVDAVVAEDIGKLPDTFASAALARLAGVQVTRGGGEAAGVTVRGLPDLMTTYNGREIFTAEGRYVQIQDFPAGTVQALEVYKSGTADMIEAGIAGEVNVRGRRPFDFKGFEVSGSLNGSDWEQGGKLSWGGNLLVSDRWNTGIGEMGLLLNVSYTGLDFQDATREQSLIIPTTTATNAPGTTGGVRYPDAQGRFTDYGHRWRPSANAAFQWKPTPELELYADGLFQGYRGRDTNRYMFVPIFGGPGFSLTNLTTRPNSNIAQSATVSGADAPNGYYGSGNGHTDTYQGGGGAVWQRDKLKISADLAYTNSTFTADTVNIDYAFANSPTRNVVFDSPLSNGGPSFDFGNYGITDPANYISRGLFQEYLRVHGQEWQARTDVQYDVDRGFLKRVQVGFRFTDHDATRDHGSSYVSNLDARVPLSALPVSTEVTHPAFSFDDTFPVYNFLTISPKSIRANLPALRDFFGMPAGRVAFNPNETFRANEKAYAVYAQLKYGFDLGSTVVDGLVGVRAVRTETNINGFTAENTGNTTTYSALSAGSSYWDYLPNVSARFGFTDKLQLRLAFTQTRTRPNFFDLNPALTVAPPFTGTPNPNDPNSTARGVSSGNPNLKPLTSNNYDASLEWYFSKAGMLSAAIFRRDAKGFTSPIVTFRDDPTYGRVRFTQTENLGNTRLQGAEASFSSFLDINGLPEWAKGFGLQANVTYVDAKGDLSSTLKDAPNVAGHQQRFPGVSRWTYNVVALYERPFFSARLAYNYRSSFVSYYSQEGAETGVRTGSVIEQPRGQLDFSTTLTPIQNITLAFDVVNMLGNPIRRYRAYDDAGDAFPRQVVYLDRTYTLGVRFRF